LAYVHMQIILWLRNTNKFSGAIVFILQGDCSSFLRFHGTVRLAHVRDRARAPAKSSYNSAFLSCSCRSCFPCPRGGICRGVLGVLQVMIWFTSALIPCSLLQFYGLELHHLTPSGILHIAAFITLCEAYVITNKIM
jgi:hypothetical protein